MTNTKLYVYILTGLIVLILFATASAANPFNIYNLSMVFMAQMASQGWECVVVKIADVTAVVECTNDYEFGRFVLDSVSGSFIQIASGIVS